MAKKSPESAADITSRDNLRKLLAKAQKFLSAIHEAVGQPARRVSRTAEDDLDILWKDANAKLSAIQQTLSIGLPKGAREGLAAVGMFGEELSAKDRIFDFLLEEKRFVSALKLLASILCRLARIFPIMSAVKEFIDAVLTFRDWMKDTDLTVLGPFK